LHSARHRLSHYSGCQPANDSVGDAGSQASTPHRDASSQCALIRRQRLIVAESYAPIAESFGYLAPWRAATPGST